MPLHKKSAAGSFGKRPWQTSVATMRSNKFKYCTRSHQEEGLTNIPNRAWDFQTRGWHRIAGRNPSCPSFNRTPPMYDGNFARFENRDNTSQLTPAHKATHKYLQRCSQAFDRPANPAIHPHAHPSVAIHHFSFSKQQSLHPPSCPST